LQLEAQVQAQLAAARLRRRRQARVRLLKRAAVVAVVLLVLAVLGFGLANAGSTGTIAAGVRIAGVDVGGMSPAAARAKLQQHEAALAKTPLPVRIGRRTFRVRPSALGVTPDWARAAEVARSRGDGFAPIRGWHRLYLAAFGAHVSVPARIDRNKLTALVAKLAGAVDRPHRDASIRLAGLHPKVTPARTGTILERQVAARLLVAAIVSLHRDTVTLPLREDAPRVTRRDLVPVAAQVRTVLSAPVRLTLGPTRYRIPRWRLAKILELPKSGSQKLRIAGPAANAFFARLEKAVNAPPKDAGFAPLASGKVQIVPAVEGRALDVPRTLDALLEAALSATQRVAPIAVSTAAPKRSTADAHAMGINEVVSNYETVFGGEPNRIHNVQLVAHLIDNTLIAPASTFSFNATTGDRNAAKGFLEAPVIINGELETGLGGGVCQVSTTVFNAAYEAGLPITARTNHALYISHYPQGRDATVDYPDVDLRFVNDTGHWLLLRTWVSSSSLTVALYGTSPHRRVESETAPLRVTGAPRVKRIKDPTLLKGKRVIDDPGSPSLATSVHRRVYSRDGTLLYDNVWYSSYRAEPRVIRVGTKPKPKPKLPTKDELTKVADQTSSLPH
jgi:vancomycin resistance protein YoaR